jgi:hypothetical protein
MQLYTRDRLVRDLGGEQRADNDFSELAELVRPAILQDGVDAQEVRCSCSGAHGLGASLQMTPPEFAHSIIGIKSLRKK